MQTKRIVGFDIGGTKCAVCVGRASGDELKISDKRIIQTDLTVAPETMLGRLAEAADEMTGGDFAAAGISCGGPLDAETGEILSPPNLPGWDRVPAAEWLQNRFGVPVRLQNDADACALAEWKFGAGRGCRHLIFLTFGTGLGAGLILNGRLYRGAGGMAGEAGHIRLAETGPAGYGKPGSFEGFCSGGGLAQLGYLTGLAACQWGEKPPWFDLCAAPRGITAKSLAEAAAAGDPTALEAYRLCGEYLGRGLAVLVDILNPEKIILGSIFVRARELLWPSAEAVLKREALPRSLARCEVTGAALGENLGDYAALTVALYDEGR